MESRAGCDKKTLQRRKHFREMMRRRNLAIIIYKHSDKKE
jgi:hypothetical protein